MTNGSVCILGMAQFPDLEVLQTECTITSMNIQGKLSCASGLEAKLLPRWSLCLLGLLLVISRRRRRRAWLLSDPNSGSATTIINNPIWVVQTSQAVQTLDGQLTAAERLSFFDTVRSILIKDGPR